jgi:hypothetical protein
MDISAELLAELRLGTDKAAARGREARERLAADARPPRRATSTTSRSTPKRWSGGSSWPRRGSPFTGSSSFRQTPSGWSAGTTSPAATRSPATRSSPGAGFDLGVGGCDPRGTEGRHTTPGRAGRGAGRHPAVAVGGRCLLPAQAGRRRGRPVLPRLDRGCRGGGRLTPLLLPGRSRVRGVESRTPGARRRTWQPD